TDHAWAAHTGVGDARDRRGRWRRGPGPRAPPLPRGGSVARRRAGEGSPPPGKALATGDVAEDDLVDQALDRRQVVGENLAVVRRQPKPAVAEDALRDVSRERLADEPRSEEHTSELQSLA